MDSVHKGQLSFEYAYHSCSSPNATGVPFELAFNHLQFKCFYDCNTAWGERKWLKSLY